MRRFLILFTVSISLAGCSNFGSIYREVSIEDSPNTSLIMDAKQRAIISIQRKDESLGGKTLDSSRTVVCSEPSPDAFTAAGQALSGSGMFSGPSQNASLALSLAMAESAGELHRAKTVQLLRDGLYYTCLGYANGLSRSKYDRLLNRYLDSTIILFAIEQITPQAVPASTTLSSNADGFLIKKTPGAAVEPASPNSPAQPAPPASPPPSGATSNSPTSPATKPPAPPAPPSPEVAPAPSGWSVPEQTLPPAPSAGPRKIPLLTSNTSTVTQDFISKINHSNPVLSLSSTPKGEGVDSSGLRAIMIAAAQPVPPTLPTAPAPGAPPAQPTPPAVKPSAPPVGVQPPPPPAVSATPSGQQGSPKQPDEKVAGAVGKAVVVTGGQALPGPSPEAVIAVQYLVSRYLDDALVGECMDILRDITVVQGSAQSNLVESCSRIVLGAAYRSISATSPDGATPAPTAGRVPAPATPPSVPSTPGEPPASPSGVQPSNKPSPSGPPAGDIPTPGTPEPSAPTRNFQGILDMLRDTVPNSLPGPAKK